MYFSSSFRHWILFAVTVVLATGNTPRKVHVDYPIDLLPPATGTYFSAKLSPDRLTCFGNRDYAAPAYFDTLLCMIPGFPVDQCIGIWGSRPVVIEATGNVELFKLASMLTHGSLQNEVISVNATRWLDLFSHTSDPSFREILQVPAEPIYLCARSNDWRGGESQFNITFKEAHIRHRDRRECHEKMLLHMCVVFALSSAWLLPYVVAGVVALTVFLHGIKVLLVLVALSACTVCLTPLMLTRRHRTLARLYFNYFFTRISAEDTNSVMRRRLPVFQALFFSGSLVLAGSLSSYALYYYGGVDRETRNTCLKVVLATAVSWFVFFVCRAFERFFRDWMWLALCVGLAQMLDARLNPLSRDKVVLASMLLSKVALVLLGWASDTEAVKSVERAVLPPLMLLANVFGVRLHSPDARHHHHHRHGQLRQLPAGGSLLRLYEGEVPADGAVASATAAADSRSAAPSDDGVDRTSTANLVVLQGEEDLTEAEDAAALAEQRDLEQSMASIFSDVPSCSGSDNCRGGDEGDCCDDCCSGSDDGEASLRDLTFGDEDEEMADPCSSGEDEDEDERSRAALSSAARAQNRRAPRPTTDDGETFLAASTGGVNPVGAVAVPLWSVGPVSTYEGSEVLLPLLSADEAMVRSLQASCAAVAGGAPVSCSQRSPLRGPSPVRALLRFSSGVVAGEFVVWAADQVGSFSSRSNVEKLWAAVRSKLQTAEAEAAFAGTSVTASAHGRGSAVCVQVGRSKIELGAAQEWSDRRTECLLEGLAQLLVVLCRRFDCVADVDAFARSVAETDLSSSGAALDQCPASIVEMSLSVAQLRDLGFSSAAHCRFVVDNGLVADSAVRLGAVHSAMCAAVGIAPDRSAPHVECRVAPQWHQPEDSVALAFTVAHCVTSSSILSALSEMQGECDDASSIGATRRQALQLLLGGTDHAADGESEGKLRSALAVAAAVAHLSCLSEAVARGDSLASALWELRK